MLIYVILTAVVTALMVSDIDKEYQKEISFTPAKRSIAFISEDNSLLIDGFREALGQIVNFVELDETQLQDALYFREVTYIVRVPAGFTEEFMKGADVKIDKSTVPNSVSNTYIDLFINQYFNTARLYIKNIDGISQELLVQYLKEDLSKTSNAEVKSTTGKKVTYPTYSNNYFNFFAYTLISVIILGMSMLMIVFNDRNLKMRNSCAPVIPGSINLQFILANLFFTFASWAILVVMSFIFNYKNSLNAYTVYFIISSFIYSFCCASISFLIGNLIKSQNAVYAVCNTIGLGSSFISGVFVPQELLSGSILKIASFTPAYWYVKANNAIAKLTQFDYRHLQPIFSDLMIVAGFGLAFFAVALAIGKRKNYIEN